VLIYSNQPPEPIAALRLIFSLGRIKIMGKTENFKFIGFWKRVLATLVDAAIGWLFMPITITMMYWEIKNRSVLFSTIFSIVWIIVFLYLVVRFGGTPGKLIIKARIVNEEGHFLQWDSAIRRIIFPTLILSINTFLLLYTVTNSYTELPKELTFLGLGELYKQYGGIYYTLSMILGCFVYVDIGTILFNKKKRAIHDFIAGSYVITRESYLENQKTN
jgi:uncharacterized RDD family membrane protein YckC